MGFNTAPDLIGSIFTKDQTVIHIVSETIPMLSVFLLFDAIHGAQSGNVRALGRQFAASVFTLVAYYVFGMPLALLFGFRWNMRVKGFWMAYMISLVALDVFVAFLVINAKWLPKALNQA